ncbi:MAG: OmpA family protein [Dinghuibacter sp.]|nr:OmpA family protein [Dinghuibacter sp.]
MKRVLLSLMAVLLVTASFAQKNPNTRKNTFGIHFFLNDFQTGRALDTAKVKDVLDRNDWYKPSRMSPGFAISLTRGLLPNIDFRGTFSASFEDYPFKKKATTGLNAFLGELDLSVNLKAVNDKHWVIPYLTAGIGGSIYKNNIGAIAPVGVGLQLNLFNETYVDLSTQLRMGITDNTTNHLYHSLGIAGNIFNKKEEVKEVAPPIITKKDTDNDGIVDDEDDCPNDAGSAALKGCPDKDGDGIADKNDNCPDKAGVAKYNGCPVPDSDGDGLNDEQDKCPNQAGVARYQGCPIPDGDGDGVNDEEDKCPTVAGVRSNQGCPEIKEEDVKKVEFAAKNIYFATGSAKLLAKSYKPLDEVAKILNENNGLKLNIDGHTDNTGNADKNSALSQTRADAVKAYLASKGVSEDSMTATGHGSDEPVADNNTASGRAKNRRVELKISY